MSLIKSALIIVFLSTPLGASVLDPAKTDHPRDTMQTFMTSMEAYRKGIDSGDPKEIRRIERAVRTLNLDAYPPVVRKEKGKEVAQLLKEVLDRVIVIDYSKIPEASADPKKPLLRWRLKGTEIVISRVEKGERAGEYLFSPDTVFRVKDFYRIVKDRPYLSGTGGGAHYDPPLLEDKIPVWARKKILFFPNWQWIGLFIAILIGLIIRVIAQHLTGAAKKVSRLTKIGWDEKILISIEKPAGLLAASGFWFFSIHVLQFEGRSLLILSVLVEIVFMISVVWGFYRLTDVLTDYLMSWASRTDSLLDDHLVPLIRRALKIFVVVFGVLAIFQNLGFNVASVFAGLGLGGLAFALAAKDTAANLFGSLMIIIDRPFQIGDWIVAGDTEGTVEEIGFRSTRVRTFYNSLVSVPNSTLANLEIDNMGRRKYRRVKATLGVTYDTPPEKLEAFLEGIKNVIKANKWTRKDYFHVVFNSYSSSSLDILVYCFLEVPDWATELVQKQNLFLEIYRLASDLEVEFAFPTQTLHVDSFPEKQTAKKHQGVQSEQLAGLAKDFGPGGKRGKPSGLGLFTPPHQEKT